MGSQERPQDPERVVPDGPRVQLGGVQILPGALDGPVQRALVRAVREIARQAPLFAPRTPGGRPLSVRMTSAGRVGWVPAPGGYGYRERHPEGMPWPGIPAEIEALWHRFAPQARPLDSCLVNFYPAGARLGLHQDRDEADLSQPIVSVSLGDDALFRAGTADRHAGTRSTWLRSGDVVLLAGAGRLAWHGVDRIRAGSSTLLRRGGRLNLTLRVAR